MDTEALLIGEIPIFFKLFHHFFNISNYFQVKKGRGRPSGGGREHPKTEKEKGHGGVTIESFEEYRPQKVILEKPSVEMTRHIKSLYVRAHLNGKPVSKVLIDNGSTINVMPLRMLRALGMSISDQIETEVVVSAFTGEVSKTLGILPIDITIDNKTLLSTFFMIDSTANYNILQGRV